MVGQRMRQARLLACLSQDEVVSRLSDLKVKLTKGGLSKYERGGSSPSAALLIVLAKALSVKPEYFLRETTTSIEWLAFRKTSRMTASAEDRVRAEAAETVEAHLWLTDRLGISDRPNFPRPIRVDAPDDAEKAAERLRSTWKLDDLPIENLTEVIEDRGGIVAECQEKNFDFDGLSGWANKIHPVTVVRGDVASDRKRFSLAHELGHLAMECSGKPAKEQETLAHRFAAAFIVPAAVAKRELGEKRSHLNFDELAMLKQKHGLSMAGWVNRAKSLGIISESHAKSIWMVFSQKGWRKAEPVQFAGDEKPTRLRQMTLRALAEGIITEERAEQLCPYFRDRRIEEDTPHRRLSAMDLLKLPAEERERLLTAAADSAVVAYTEGGSLSGFDAFGEKDLLDAHT